MQDQHQFQLSSDTSTAKIIKMKYFVLLFVAFLALAMAFNSVQACLSDGSTCKADGSMGNCCSQFCLQQPNTQTGYCA
ncbi:unnamed protein product [Brassicogethes aeneus]|uniref:Uncharacterized protein n=1 Tax=Brassicogethes aeneus TaxID=1431903 RepID=A0A9P0BI31_BRAAE|nr:unnamed protein product [Brassicogethes aeneus]